MLALIRKSLLRICTVAIEEAKRFFGRRFSWNSLFDFFKPTVGCTANKVLLKLYSRKETKRMKSKERSARTEVREMYLTYTHPALKTYNPSALINRSLNMKTCDKINLSSEHHNNNNVKCNNVKWLNRCSAPMWEKIQILLHKSKYHNQHLPATLNYILKVYQSLIETRALNYLRKIDEKNVLPFKKNLLLRMKNRATFCR